jgi:hypothetical protein
LAGRAKPETREEARIALEEKSLRWVGAEMHFSDFAHGIAGARGFPFFASMGNLVDSLSPSLFRLAALPFRIIHARIMNCTELQKTL